MPRPVPPDLRLGVVAPTDAVAAFNRRDLLWPSFAADDVWQQEHLRGYASAGVMRYDILQLLRDETGIALQAGHGAKEFVASVRAKLIDKGFWGDVEVTHPNTGELRTTRFNDARLRLIHDVNLGQSYMAGKAERYQRTKKYLPLLQYITKRDERVRASHAKWDNVVLPIDDPWWTLHHPRKAWRCRCDVAALSERQVQRLRDAGLDIKTTPPEDVMVDQVDARTGEALRLPAGVDPAFAYHPGQRPLAGTVPPPLLGDPFSRLPSLQPVPAMPTPRLAPAGALLPAGTPAEAAVQTFLGEFGASIGKPVVHTDVQGQPLAITEELFKNIKGDWKVKRGREQFVRLLAQAIKAPDEIWQAFELHQLKGKEVLRRRYLVRYLLEGEAGADPVPVTAVFETGKDGWLGITTYQAENAEAADTVLRSVRHGVRVWVRGGNNDEGNP